ncbi:NUDIX domain-containing protein [Anaerocolumna sp. MB42-C2]|uniref:NUDIX domain-containing protein n=1 Tax=Anaerocolumna sp. MB42-C2 TaxID=3070997 RepID=UPI0027E10ECE|nr:NUDIX domain-containing protein [Anaerocolumna sp. MB42-C2]WMJ85516.1 NUDIX domain-containing protein [Anaerocolumna sp. MB42-C2]
MIKLRNMATAYLMSGSEILLMKRAAGRKLAPGLWAGVGGHLEPEELNNPMEACLREIYEETGITQEQLTDIKLKYIVLRRYKDEIRIQYIYFGQSRTKKVINTEEGELFWINRDKLFERVFTATNKIVLQHYMEFEDETKDVLVGTVSAKDDSPVMNWCPLKDWEISLKE